MERLLSWDECVDTIKGSIIGGDQWLSEARGGRRQSWRGPSPPTLAREQSECCTGTSSVLASVARPRTCQVFPPCGPARVCALAHEMCQGDTDPLNTASGAPLLNLCSVWRFLAGGYSLPDPEHLLVALYASPARHISCSTSESASGRAMVKSVCLTAVLALGLGSLAAGDWLAPPAKVAKGVVGFFLQPFSVRQHGGRTCSNTGKGSLSRHQKTEEPGGRFNLDFLRPLRAVDSETGTVVDWEEDRRRARGPDGRIHSDSILDMVMRKKDQFVNVVLEMEYQAQLEVAEVLLFFIRSVPNSLNTFGRTFGFAIVFAAGLQNLVHDNYISGVSRECTAVDMLGQHVSGRFVDRLLRRGD